jgi:hypothetical protein
MQLPKMLYVKILFKRRVLGTLQKRNLNTHMNAGVAFTYTVETQNLCKLRLKESYLGFCVCIKG